MKLLLDQNLSYRLVQTLIETYPDSTQVSMLGMGDALDKAIWSVARDRGFSIVTQDADFHEYSLLWGGPPLIVWLKCGNQPKGVILEKLLENQGVIERAYSDADIWCIEIY